MALDLLCKLTIVFELQCNCGNGTNSYNYNSKCVNAQHCNHTRCYNCEVFE